MRPCCELNSRRPAPPPERQPSMAVEVCRRKPQEPRGEALLRIEQQELRSSAGAAARYGC